jgi:hypothetical protein
MTDWKIPYRKLEIQTHRLMISGRTQTDVEVIGHIKQSNNPEFLLLLIGGEQWVIERNALSKLIYSKKKQKNWVAVKKWITKEVKEDVKNE